MKTPKHKPHVNIGNIKSDTKILENALKQIQKLKSDKAELLEALEKSKPLIDCFVTHDEIESLIQKHKQ